MGDDWYGILKVVRRTSPGGILENLVLDTKQPLPPQPLPRSPQGRERKWKYRIHRGDCK